MENETLDYVNKVIQDGECCDECGTVFKWHLENAKRPSIFIGTSGMLYCAYKCMDKANDKMVYQRLAGLKTGLKQVEGK